MKDTRAGKKDRRKNDPLDVDRKLAQDLKEEGEPSLPPSTTPAHGRDEEPLAEEGSEGTLDEEYPGDDEPGEVP